eukprot:gene52803-72057_t
MPDAYPDYPSNRQLLAYLQAFARDQRLEDHITYNSEVVHAEKTASGWRVRFGDGVEQSYRWLVTAVGTNWHPYVPDFEGTFAGEMIHSNAYHSAESLKGKRVLVVGAGNSGCDIARDAARATQGLRRASGVPRHGPERENCVERGGRMEARPGIEP